MNICSADLWTSSKYKNTTWQLVYHTLFFTDLYLYQDLDTRINWVKHRNGYQDLGNEADKVPYEKEELLAYLDYIDERLESAIASLDLTREDCGFYWYKVNKLEHQLVNLKHLQHHIGQLQDRIRNDQGQGIGWIRDGAVDQR